MIILPKLPLPEQESIDISTLYSSHYSPRDLLIGSILFAAMGDTCSYLIIVDTVSIFNQRKNKKIYLLLYTRGFKGR